MNLDALNAMIANAEDEAKSRHPSSGPGNYWKVRLDALREARDALIEDNEGGGKTVAVTVLMDEDVSSEEETRVERAVREAADVVAAMVAYRSGARCMVTSDVPMSTQHYVNTEV